jgi:hypothetical protein
MNKHVSQYNVAQYSRGYSAHVLHRTPPLHVKNGNFVIPESKTHRFCSNQGRSYFSIVYCNVLMPVFVRIGVEMVENETRLPLSEIHRSTNEFFPQRYSLTALLTRTTERPVAAGLLYDDVMFV